MLEGIDEGVDVAELATGGVTSGGCLRCRLAGSESVAAAGAISRGCVAADALESNFALGALLSRLRMTGVDGPVPTALDVPAEGDSHRLFPAEALEATALVAGISSIGTKFWRADATRIDGNSSSSPSVPTR